MEHDDSQINRLEDKIDKIVDNICAINITTAKQAISLEEHIKRTNILEGKIVPLEENHAMAKGILKLIGFLAIFFGAIEALLRLIGK